jgi:hypothetical protein
MHLGALPTGSFVPTELHQRLARLAGRWKGTAKTYADPSNPDAAESASWESVIEMLLGGRFMRFTYASEAMGQPIAGEFTLAYEQGDGVFRMSWIDSLHTSPAIMVQESKAVGAGDAQVPISVVGSYFAGAGQPRWGWRTELHDQTEGTLAIRMFNIMPDGAESIGVDITLVRGGAS